MINKILLSILLVLLQITTSFALSDVYYSVGQDTSTDNMTGSPTLTMTSGVATFTVAQTGNIGVGDRVTYDTSKVAYIGGKTLTTVWTLITATGAIPANEASAVTINSIKREFASLSAAEAGSSNASHINNTDLTAAGADVALHLPCYQDAALNADTTAVSIDGWTTDSTHFIKVYTPTDTALQVNTSQRHDGKWNTSKYRLEVSSAVSTAALGITEAYVKVDGLQISADATSTNTADVLTFSTSYGASSYIEATNNILKGINNNYGSGIYVNNSTGYIYNNIIYDLTGSTSYGIYANSTTGSLYIYNNTITNCDYGVHGASGVTLKNNLLYNHSLGATSNMTVANCGYNSTNAASLGYTAQTGDRIYQTFSFTDAGALDWHITSTDTGARNRGTSLSGTFTTDVDGETRGTVWDIGSDEILPEVLTVVSPRRFYFEDWE